MSETSVGGRRDQLPAEERAALLRAAREALRAHFAGREPDLPPAQGALAQPWGAFVTLHRRADGELRGCVGMMQSSRPLVETVARMALAAATEDSRFDPVRAGELPQLRIEVSVLGPLEPIAARGGRGRPPRAADRARGPRAACCCRRCR